MANLHVLTYEGLKNYTTKFLAKITATFAKITDLNAHKSDTTAHMSATQKSQLSSAYSHSTSAHAPSNAQPNQNAFSNISVGDTTITADNATDTLTVAGSNVTITPDATNDKVTIGITKANVTAALGYTPPTTDTKYTHPSYTAHGEGLYKTTVDSTGHVSAVTAVTKADITALGIPGQDTKYGAAGTALGLVKTGGDVTIASGVISVNDNSHNHTVANVAGLQGILDDKAPSSHTHSNYVNQNAFSNVVVGATTMAADTSTDTLTLVAGSNVTLTPDAENDKITIAAKDTTYEAASTSANGLMTSAMVTKLNGIADGANKYVLPAAAKDVLGGVKTSSEVTSASGYTACPIIAGIPYYKDTNTTYNLDSFGVTATANELNCTKGATSNLQTQINTINSTLSSYWSHIYPIGAIYISTSPANPSTFLGGTWVAWGSGRVPVGFNSDDGNFNISEKTGGSKTINLAHSHTVNTHSHASGSMYAGVDATATWIGVSRVGGKSYNCDVYANTPIQGKSYTANFGARVFGNTGNTAPGTNSQLSGSQSILPPYVTCYMWKRTA